MTQYHNEQARIAKKCQLVQTHYQFPCPLTILSNSILQGGYQTPKTLMDVPVMIQTYNSFKEKKENLTNNYQFHIRLFYNFEQQKL